MADKKEKSIENSSKDKEKKEKKNLSPQERAERKKETNRKIIRLSITVVVVLALCLAVYLPLKLTGTLDRLSSIEEIRALIESGGVWSYLIYFLFQFLQATFIPIPAFVTTVAGAWIFGPWIACLISFLSILAASILMFFLGRKLGRPIVSWIVGKEDAIKWEERLGKGKYVFFLMMLFPLFPDDILCLAAGATTISFRFFILTMFVARPISIITTCFVGSGELIPFSGWGIPVWIVLIIAMIILFYVSIKHQSKIEEWITKLGEKMGLKSKNKKEKSNKNETIKDEIQDAKEENINLEKDHKKEMETQEKDLQEKKNGKTDD